MATHVSAEKRYRQSLKRLEHNRAWKSRVRTATKAATSSAKEPKNAAEKLKEAVSEIYKARREGVLHPNTAARKVARLTKKLTNLKA